jgi:hypothetical protein
MYQIGKLKELGKHGTSGRAPSQQAGGPEFNLWYHPPKKYKVKRKKNKVPYFALLC